jgi:hypothetical protein
MKFMAKKRSILGEMMDGVSAMRKHRVPFPVKIKIKVKRSGQECPLHTSSSCPAATAP